MKYISLFPSTGHTMQMTVSSPDVQLALCGRVFGQMTLRSLNSSMATMSQKVEYALGVITVLPAVGVISEVSNKRDPHACHAKLVDSGAHRAATVLWVCLLYTSPSPRD